MPAGRPTELDDELCLRIRQWILEGKTIKEIAKLSEIPEETYEGWVWRNYKGFAEKLRFYKIERRLKKAEENIDEFLDMETENIGVTKKGDTFTYEDAKLKKIKADISTFVAETVGKKDYSKRSEHTGADGAALFKWQDDEHDNDTVQTKEVGEDVSPEHETMDSSGAPQASWEDDGDTEPSPA